MAGGKLGADLKRPNTIEEDDELEAKIDELCQDRVRDLIWSANQRLAGKLAHAEDELARTRQVVCDVEEHMRKTNTTLRRWILEAQQKEDCNPTAVGLYPSTPRMILQNEPKNTQASTDKEDHNAAKSGLAPRGSGSGGLAGYYLGRDGNYHYKFGSNSQMPTKTKVASGDYAEVARKRKRDDYCDLCHVVMQSKQVRRDHLKSRGHQLRQQKQKGKTLAVN